MSLAGNRGLQWAVLEGVVWNSTVVAFKLRTGWLCWKSPFSNKPLRRPWGRANACSHDPQVRDIGLRPTYPSQNPRSYAKTQDSGELAQGRSHLSKCMRGETPEHRESYSTLKSYVWLCMICFNTVFTLGGQMWHAPQTIASFGICS